MKRRNFIKNAGLGLAGLALSNNIYSGNLPVKKSLNIYVLMSGGIDFNDIIDEKNNRIHILFDETAQLELHCKTNLTCNSRYLEHPDAVINALHFLNGNPSDNIFISNPNSDVTKTLIDSNLPLTVISTAANNYIHPYRNDAAIFEKAFQLLQNSNHMNMILNLEDTDIAHIDKQKYFDVLKYYNQAIDQLCKKVFSADFKNTCNIAINVTSVIGRNNFSNEIHNDINQTGTDHYDESARKLFSFDIKYASGYLLNFDHSKYDGKNLFYNHAKPKAI